MTPVKLIGLAGTAGAGKDTAANLLCQMFTMQNLSTSEVLRAITRHMYNEPTTYNPVRNQLFQVGTFIRTEINPSTLVKLCILQAEVLRLERAIITGLRSIGEAEAIRSAGGIIVAVDAEAHVRYDRMFARARDADSQKTLEEFLEQDRIENRGVSDSGPGRGIQAIIDGADVVVVNNGGLDALEVELRNKVMPLLQI
jgi:dephospho-CoA kinase